MSNVMQEVLDLLDLETIEQGIYRGPSRNFFGKNVFGGQVLGQAPGKLNLPGQGTYRLQVTSEGFTPATLDVTVPRNAPVTIHLGQ